MDKLRKSYLSISGIGIVLLVLLVLVSGYFFYNKPSGTPPPPISPAPSSPQPLARHLTPEEQELLNFKDHNPTEATGAQKIRHDELIRQLAKNADFLDITGCRAEPLVLRVRMDEDITVRNRDDMAHILHQGPRQEIEVPPKGEIIVPARAFFTRAPANYPYACDNLSQTVGLFAVEP